MARHRSDTRRPGRPPPVFSAIDLGTNNCRLLVAVPARQGFRVVDAYSQIVRLGEGVGRTGQLSDAAMERTVSALKVCAEKMARRNVGYARNIATQACRAAANAVPFFERIRAETGLSFDLATPEEEAALSVAGCHDLVGDTASAALVFDIGGGSTELSWLRITRDHSGRAVSETVTWTSLPVGVVTLAESHDAPELAADVYRRMADEVAASVRAHDVPADISAAFAGGKGHLIGTSGTVTSLAGVHLGLSSYQRSAIDGIWMTPEEVRAAADSLRSMDHAGRAAEPCVGPQRADLVVPGCAILEGILTAWPTPRIRVGDRGLREGMLIGLIDSWRRGG